MAEINVSLSKTASILKSEDGAAIIAAIMILVLLSIIGIASTNVSNTEVQIAGQEVIYQQNLYQAEGAAIEAAQQLDGILNPKSAPPAWIETTLDVVTDTDIYDNNFWAGGGSVVPQPSLLADSSFVVVSEGIVDGSSLGMHSSKVHAYAVYGRSAPPNRGATVIELGYLKAF